MFGLVNVKIFLEYILWGVFVGGYSPSFISIYLSATSIIPIIILSTLSSFNMMRSSISSIM